MEPIASQETRFEIVVTSPIDLLHRLQVFIGGLIIFAAPMLYVIVRSTAPTWLVVTVTIALFIGLIAFYRLAKSHMFARLGYTLVREELERLNYYDLHLRSFEHNGRFTAIRTLNGYKKVNGVLTLVKAEDRGSVLTYRIDLLPE